MLYPLLAMVTLVFTLMLIGFTLRYRAVMRKEVSLGYFRIFSGDAPRYIQQANRHYSNLFEMPVLFYTAAVLSLLYPIEGPWITTLAWGFVIARIAHAAIHLTYNNVLHRAAAFQLANLCLIGLWIILGVTLAG